MTKTEGEPAKDAAATEKPSHEDIDAALQDAVAQVQRRLAARKDLAAARARNEAPPRPSAAELAQLEASIKRNNAVARKLRVLTDATLEGALADVRSTNQSKFLSETVAALLEAALKPSRVPCVLEVLGCLHERYGSLREELAAALQKALQAELEPSDSAAVLRRRALLKLSVEVDLRGVLPTARMLQPVIAELARVNLKLDGAAPIAALAQLSTFVKSAKEDMLLSPADMPVPLPAGSPSLQDLVDSSDATLAARSRAVFDGMAELGRAMSDRYTLPQDLAAPLQAAVKGALEKALSVLVQMHAALCDAEDKADAIVLSRGALTEAMQAKLASKMEQYTKFKEAATSFASACGREPPHLKQRAPGATHAGGLTLLQPAGDGDAAGERLWDDDQTAVFYESLPDLVAVVPSLALERGQADDAAGEAVAETAEASEGAAEDSERQAADAALADGDGSATHDPDQEALRATLERLRECSTAERADDLAVSFCFIQTKGKRKSLARALGDLFKVPMQQLPFLARVTATLAQQFPDMGRAVVAAAQQSFRSAMKSKDATLRTLEPRLRAARYIAELCKFRIADPDLFFVSLKRCLDDFSGHSIDTACELVEGAGAFMLRQAATAPRMQHMLAIIQRLRGGRHMEPAKAQLIDAALYACKPASSSALRDRTRTPLQRYVRYLLFDFLSAPSGGGGGEGGEAALVRHLRRLPWDECEDYVIRTTLKAAARGSFAHVAALASVVTQLNRYQPAFVIALVDMLLEDMHAALCAPAMAAPQARIAHARLLAELYNHKIARHQLLFYALYLQISLGYESAEKAAAVDPPDDFLRTRAAIAMLQASGHYFVRGATRPKLDRFMLLLQQYILRKAELPADVEADWRALFKKLQPKQTRLETLEEADAAVEALLQQEAKAANMHATVASDDDDAADDDDDDEAGAPRVADTAVGTPTIASSLAHSGGETEGMAEGAVVLHDEWLQEQEVDEVFEKELAAVLPTQVAAPANRARAASPRAAPPGVASESVAFRVRLRKPGPRGDADNRRVALPASSAIAARLAAQRAREDAERGELKRLVLAAERTQAEEEREAARAGLAASVAAAPRRRPAQERRGQKGSGFRLEERDFHEEVRNVRGTL